jgi:phosphoglycolate phosphatase-like HAD superfamily hydrolase
MQEYAIFDFDGTLTNLTVDWDFVKKELSVARISDLWILEEPMRQQAFEIVSAHERQATENKLILDRNKLESISCFSILTNNSEKTVKYFFDLINLDMRFRQINPCSIIGRETLGGPKENEDKFRNGINLIFSQMGISESSECLYVGDQKYELKHAMEMGLKTIDIRAFM